MKHEYNESLSLGKPGDEHRSILNYYMRIIYIKVFNILALPAHISSQFYIEGNFNQWYVFFINQLSVIMFIFALGGCQALKGNSGEIPGRSRRCKFRISLSS